jgi:origin recognition complex subunit 6
MRPTVRFLCKELNTAQIGPVIMAGVETIVTPHGKRTTDSWITSNLVPLLGALYLIVWKGVTFPGKDLDQERYIRARKDVVTALQKARSTLTLPSKGTDTDDGGWEGWTDVKVKDIDNATLRINRHGWLESDWAHGIGDLIARNADAIDEAMELDGSGNDNGVEVGGGKVRRADTMFQDRNDYLSERKKQEYAVWKEGILRRIKELERGPPTADAMDIDP